MCRIKTKILLNNNIISNSLGAITPFKIAAIKMNDEFELKGKKKFKTLKLQYNFIRCLTIAKIKNEVLIVAVISLDGRFIKLPCSDVHVKKAGSR